MMTAVNQMNCGYSILLRRQVIPVEQSAEQSPSQPVLFLDRTEKLNYLEIVFT